MPRPTSRTLALPHAGARTAAGTLGAVLAAAALVGPATAQAIAKPQPTCIRNVTLDRSGERDQRHTIVLRDGKIDAILDADAPTPPATREIDGEGLLCLPAFLRRLFAHRLRDARAREGPGRPRRRRVRRPGRRAPREPQGHPAVVPRGGGAVQDLGNRQTRLYDRYHERLHELQAR